MTRIVSICKRFTIAVAILQIFKKYEKIKKNIGMDVTLLKLTVVGMGFVGLVTAIGFASKGNQVFALDSDKKKIVALRKNEVNTIEPKLEETLLASEANIRFTAETRDAIYGADLIFICTETSEKDNDPCDMTTFYQTLKDICRFIQNDVTVVIRSTVPVGTCQEVKDYMMTLTNKKYKIDVVSNPEFLAQGTAMKDMLNPARIVIGVSSRDAYNKLKELYSNFNAPLLFVSQESAELIKYASNGYLAVKLSYINELADLCDAIGADIQEVSVGIGLDPRIGNKYMSSGIGYGGPSLPLDTKVLSILAKNNDIDLTILDAAVSANERRPHAMIEKMKKELGSISGMRFAVLGLSYKGNTIDIRRSPAFKVIEELIKEDCRIIAYDSVATTPFRKKMKSDQRIAYANTLDEALKTCDAAIFLNDCEEFKKLTNDEIIEYMKKPIVFDGKGVLNPYQLKDVKYYAIGKKSQ